MARASFKESTSSGMGTASAVTRVGKVEQETADILKIAKKVEEWGRKARVEGFYMTKAVT